jgi:hypothetical protein
LGSTRIICQNATALSPATVFFAKLMADSGSVDSACNVWQYPHAGQRPRLSGFTKRPPQRGQSVAADEEAAGMEINGDDFRGVGRGMDELDGLPEEGYMARSPPRCPDGGRGLSRECDHVEGRIF